MGTTSQNRAVKEYRQRLQKRGMARFEVLGLEKDRELIRQLAKKLAENGQDTARIRVSLRRTISGEPSKGGVFHALRRSPLVGADLDLTRSFTSSRKLDL
jgi:hypothetical protein